MHEKVACWYSREANHQLKIENRLLEWSRPVSPPRTLPITLLLSNVSPSAKWRATDWVKEKKNLLPRGFQRHLRATFGTNLYIQSQPKQTSPSSLQTSTKAFLCQDHISKLCPDKNKTVDGQQISYRLKHLSTLHEIFACETKMEVDYVTFTRHVSSNIKKPSVESWGTCLCIYCLNPQLKYEKLTQLKHPSVKKFMLGARADLSEMVKDEDVLRNFKLVLLSFKSENFNVTYSEWQKQKKPNCIAAVSTKMILIVSIEDFLKKFFSEIKVGFAGENKWIRKSAPNIQTLKDHFHWVHEQFRAAKAAKVAAKEQDGVATIQLDWSENYNLKQAGEEKSTRSTFSRKNLPLKLFFNTEAFYFEQNIALLTGKVWMKHDSFSFGAINHDTNHVSDSVRSYQLLL
jgi:hypothetical protein